MQKQDNTMHQFDAIYGEISNVYHEINRKLGLTDTESIVLYSVAVDENVSQKAICSLSGLSKQTINSAIKKMITDGILEPLSGQKNENLIPTQKGQKIIKEKISILIEMENRIFTSWKPEERKIFIDLYARYLDMIKDECDNLEV
jgi:DNA-binding MarR family transcriptional regulator